MHEETDGQLVARVRQGDIAAFEAIVDRHRAALVAVAAARLGSPADAEDVAQEAFVQAYFRLDQLREPEALPAWLRRLTDRLALMRLRRRREEPVEPARLERMRAGTAAQAEGGADELLGRLPDGMRQAVALTCLAGYTSGEAAALLGVKEGTVRSRLSRARAMMREVIEMAGEETGKGKPGEEFTRETVERLMREARRLMAEGDVEGAARRADEALGIQLRELFESGDDPGFQFNMEAARIKGLPFKARRIEQAEANAAQYGFALEELDWEVADVDMMEGTLGKPTGRGKDVWGVPRSRMELKIVDARDIGRRLGCSPQMLHEWVEKGCPILRCWPFARFDLDRVKQWLADNGIEEWPKESARDLDRPIRVIFKALYRRELTPEEAEGVITNLGWGDWG
jgi:RNA polymerase sigma-70 factor (ECF subfamily)